MPLAMSEFRERILHPGLSALYQLGGPRASQDAERHYLRNWRPGKPHPETWWAH